MHEKAGGGGNNNSSGNGNLTPGVFNNNKELCVRRTQKLPMYDRISLQSKLNVFLFLNLFFFLLSRKMATTITTTTTTTIAKGNNSDENSDSTK